MACGHEWEDPGAPEHVLCENEEFCRWTGKNATAIAFIATRALAEGGFDITRYRGVKPDCPMGFPPDRCSGCRAVASGLPHSHTQMQGDPTR
jgi:hypothetical protein